MKKLLSIGMIICSVASMEAALPLMRQKGSIFAKIFQKQMRSKVSLAALAEAHKSLPRTSFKYSPLLGAANTLNGTLSRELKHGNKELAGAFFNQIQEEPVCYTVLPFKVALSLTPKLIGELVALHASGDLYKQEFFESTTFNEWHALFNSSRDKKNFRYQVKKQVLNLMQQESDQEKVRELLLAAVYFKGDTADDLQAFLHALKITLSDDETVQDQQVMKQYADTFLELTVSKKDLSFLQAEEIAGMARYCSEKALWSVLNIIFYNRETGLLDLAMVPEEIQKTCLPEFASFIFTYSNPTTPKFYQLAHKDFLKLVHGIDGVKYLRGSVEVPGERSETLKILNHLLGTQASSYQELAKILSAIKKRMVKFVEPTQKEYGSIHVIVNDRSAKTISSGTWSFGSGHVYFVFDKQNKNNVINVKEIEKLDTALNFSGVLVRLIPGYLHRIINWSNASVEDVVSLLKKYKVIKDELNELSQGLAEKKCTLLHTAIEKNKTDLVQYFLDKGIDPNAVDSNGDSPLMLALQKKNTVIAQALVSARANINGCDDWGYSFLNRAVSRGEIDVVRLCLELGADPAGKNKYGKSALQIAQQEGHREIENLLKDALTKARQKKIENLLKDAELRSSERFGFMYKAKAAVALFISNYL